jgi:hypothetical protein
MSGDAHVRICESLGVRFPRATRLVVSLSGKQRYMWRAVDGECEARFLTFSFSPGATRLRHCDCYANSFAARALSRRLSSLINCDLTARPFVKLAIRDYMSKACVPTTARRTRISQFDDESERCKASNQPDLLSASFLFMRRSTIHSMFNGI